jgi:hypothetical protein
MGDTVTVIEGKTEEELWNVFKKTRDPRIRDAFVRQYAPLVKYVAGKIAVSMPHTVEFDDIYRYAVYHPGCPTIAAALATQSWANSS